MQGADTWEGWRIQDSSKYAQGRHFGFGVVLRVILSGRLESLLENRFELRQNSWTY